MDGNCRDPTSAPHSHSGHKGRVGGVEINTPTIRVTSRDRALQAAGFTATSGGGVSKSKERLLTRADWPGSEGSNREKSATRANTCRVSQAPGMLVKDAVLLSPPKTESRGKELTNLNFNKFF